ncbi:MAG: hypothetical protein JNN18_01145 [Rubrivivax sp.]|nr:hypothetical protein [Rubrivivax sp.]
MPTLVLDDGTPLTEALLIVQWLEVTRPVPEWPALLGTGAAADGILSRAGIALGAIEASTITIITRKVTAPTLFDVIAAVTFSTTSSCATPTRRGCRRRHGCRRWPRRGTRGRPSQPPGPTSRPEPVGELPVATRWHTETIMRLQPARPVRFLEPPATLAEAAPAPDDAAARQAAQVWLERFHDCVCLALDAYGERSGSSGASAGVEVFEFRDTGLNLRALAKLADGRATVAFRGTVGVFGLSCNWRKVNLKAGHVGEPARHAGFAAAWDVLRPQIERWLAEHRPQSVALTGHSMGAALAQLAALDLRHTQRIEQVVLFATPMLGGAEFNRLIVESSLGDEEGLLEHRTRRYLMLTDAIGWKLPMLLGYEPLEPVERIDRGGVPQRQVPGSFAQAATAVMAPAGIPVSEPGYLRGLARSAPDMGPPHAIEALVPSFKPMAVAYGPLGWVALYMAAWLGALAKAVGYHSMVGYAEALGARTRRPFLGGPS